MHLLGRPKTEFTQFYKIAGIDSPEETGKACADAAETTPLFKSFGGKEGLWCLDSSFAQIQAIQYLGGFLPEPQARTFASTLPPAGDFFDLGMAGPVNLGMGFDVYSLDLIAVMFEKLGEHAKALEWVGVLINRPHDLQSTKADGSSLNELDKRYFRHYLGALCCKGRVLASLGENADAMDAFETAIATAASSPGHKLLEALALRDLSRSLPQAAVGEGASQDTNFLRALEIINGMLLTTEQFNNLRF
jgi:hypothetical protein